MQDSYITGLKLKNSLTGKLVNEPLYRNNLCLWTAEMWNGTHVGRLYIHIVTWVMPETTYAMIWSEELWKTISNTMYKYEMF